MKLNKDKPYCHVAGEHSAAFEQDGAFFDIHGNEIVVEQEDDTQSLATSGKTRDPDAATKVRAPNKVATNTATGKKRGPKPVTEEKPASPVDAQIAAQVGA